MGRRERRFHKSNDEFHDEDFVMDEEQSEEFEEELELFAYRKKEYAG